MPKDYSFGITYLQEGRSFRNIATLIGAIVAGKGTPFKIYYYGNGYIK